MSIVCDRNKDLGCYIDIPVELLAFTNRPVTGRVEGPVVSFSVSYGNYNMIIPDIQPDYDHTLANFPIYIPSDRKKFLLVKSGLGMKLSNVLEKKHEGQVDGPYQFWMDNNMINFRGKLKDLYSNELIGWFDDNEFGVIKPCSFSWNKDRGGVEILDRYGNVIFSVNTIIINKQNGDIKVDGLNFKGYFRTEDKYYIFNDTTSFVTDNIKEAEKLIAEIEPVFDHYGRYSQGIRLGKEIDK